MKNVVVYFIKALTCHIVFLYFLWANKCADFHACCSRAAVAGLGRTNRISVWSLLGVVFLQYYPCRCRRGTVDSMDRTIAHWLHLICVEFGLWNLLFNICLPWPPNSLEASPDRGAAVHYSCLDYWRQQRTSIAAFNFCFLADPVHVPDLIKLIWSNMDCSSWVLGYERPTVASRLTPHMLAVNVWASPLLVLSFSFIQLSLDEWQHASACSAIY